MSNSTIESLHQTSLLRPFYTGGDVRFGQQSRYIYSSYNGGVSVVDSASGQTYAQIHSENDTILVFAVNPRNNNELVTVGQSLLCRHWEIVGSNEVVMLRAWASGHAHVVTSIDINGNGSLVATAGIDKTVRVFALPGYFAVSTYKLGSLQQDPISVLRFNPSRLNILVSSGPDNQLLVWDLAQSSLSTPVLTLKGHMSTVHTVSFSPCGSVMYSSGNDQMVIAWSVETGAVVNQVAVFESVKCVHALSVSECVTVGDKGSIRLWKDRKCVAEKVSGHGANGLLNIVFAANRQLFVVGADLGISVWTFSLQSALLTFERTLTGNLGEVVSLKYLPDKPHHIICAVNDEFPRIMDLTTFGSEQKLVGHTDICLSVAVSADGQFIATGSKDQSVMLWSAREFNLINTYKGHTGAVTSVMFSNNKNLPEGLRIVSGSEDGTVKIWRVVDGPSVASYKRLIIRSIIAHSKSVNVVSVSKNDKYFASGSQDRVAKIFALADGALVGACSGHKRGVWGVDFSPIEQILATSSGDGTVKLWNIASPGSPCIRSFDLHEHAVLSCRFLPSGVQMVSADAIGCLKLWNTRNGECVASCFMSGDCVSHTGDGSKSGQKKKSEIKEVHTDDLSEENSAKIWTLDFNNKLDIITGAANGTIQVWSDNTQQIEEEKRVERSDAAQKDTAVQVLIKSGMFRDAFKTAFELNRPKQMLEVVAAANWTLGSVNEDAGTSTNQSINVTDFVHSAITSENAKSRIIAIIKEWAKYAKTSPIAFALLREIVLNSGSTELDNETVKSLSVLAEKHLARLTHLSQKCFILDAILIAGDAAPTDAAVNKLD